LISQNVYTSVHGGLEKILSRQWILFVVYRNFCVLTFILKIDILFDKQNKCQCY